MRGRNVLLTIVGMIIAGVVILSPYQLAAKDATGPSATTVAVVDMDKLFKEFQQTKEFNDRLSTKQDKFRQEAKTKVDRIELLRAELENFNPGSKDYQQRDDQLLILATEFEAFNKLSGERLKREFREWTENIYQQLLDTVGQVAQQLGYDLVLYMDSVEIQQGDDFAAVLAKIRQRKVLYARESINITQQVLKTANDKFRTSKTREPQP